MLSHGLMGILSHSLIGMMSHGLMVMLNHWLIRMLCVEVGGDVKSYVDEDVESLVDG